MTRRHLRLYIGTYTGKASRGIYQVELDRDAGVFSVPQLAAEAENPSFLAMHPSGRSLYAVEEVSDYQGQPSGSVSSFEVNRESGALTLLNRVASGGGAPCYIQVDADGACALVANYGGGSVAAIPIREDGSLGEVASRMQHEGKGSDPERQAGPHCHSILPDPTNQFSVAADLGLDRIYIYRMAEGGTLKPNDQAYASTPAGAGPRHLAFHPNGRWLYAIQEMGGHVSVFRWDAEKGELALHENVPALPEDDAEKPSSAHVAVHPSGRYVYASNRGGHDNIAIFAVDAASGRLIPHGHVPSGGKEPRHFILDPTGDWMLVAHQDSDEVTLLRVDAASGQLTKTSESVSLSMPVCVCPVS